jgi:spermidine/putrescine transport system ATP-binding protein
LAQDIAQLEPNLRPVNTVFQQYALFPHMTVADNVAFGLKMKGMALAERRPGRGRDAGDGASVGLLPTAAAQLSGGQQQRVALARALAPQPPRCCCWMNPCRRWT